MSDDFKSSVESAANSAAYSAQQAGNAIQQGAHEVGASVQKTASEVVDIMSEGAKDVSSAAHDAAGSAAESAQKAADASKNSVDDLVDEFNRVGNQVADSARSIWESEERKDLQDAVVKTLTSIAAAIEEQFKKVADKEETKKLVGKLEETTDKVVESVKSSKTAQDAGEGILKGLQNAANSIEKWLNQQKSDTPAAPPSAPAETASDGEEILITKDE